MARKGGVQQLQTEINTDEELENFLTKPGLIILDVYTEWCGPCLAMVGSLKKIKLEQGGDDLNLAIVKSDNIDVFKRFRNKSEPTWLFVSHGKIVNCAFGSNVPELMSMITQELAIERNYRDGNGERTFYELTEMCAIEMERYNIKKAIEEEVERIEKEAADKRRREYLLFVTDEIMNRAADMGVTVLMPHTVARDLFKKLTEQADKFHLIAKDKKTIKIQSNDISTLHFECLNPLSDKILEHIFDKDTFMVCWKIADDELRPVEEVLTEFVNEISQPHQFEIDENGQEIEIETRIPLLKSISIIVGKSVQLRLSGQLNDLLSDVRKSREEKKENNTNDENVVDANGDDKSTNDDTNNMKESPVIMVTNEDDNKDIVDNNVDVKNNTADITENDNATGNIENDIVPLQQPEIQITQAVDASTDENVTKIRIPAMWTPINKRANAALIYLYFRNLTDHFLPPDPVPEPPHLAIAFDAYKRKDIMDLFEQYSDAILAYGYFTTDDPKTAQLIANSTNSYQKKTPNIADKLVVKLAKSTSHALLTLATHGPSYVSQNTEIGKIECLSFFPEGYVVESETIENEGEGEQEQETKKKRKKKKKAKQNKDDVTENEVDNEDGDDIEDDEEGKLTKDDDISTGVGADNEINNTSDNVEADG